MRDGLAALGLCLLALLAPLLLGGRLVDWLRRTARILALGTSVLLGGALCLAAAGPLVLERRADRVRGNWRSADKGSC